MKAPLRIPIVALLLFALTPAAGEVVENLGHLLGEGHVAHAAVHADEHPEPDPEHGCNGTFHLCSCHSSQTPVLARSASLGAVEAVRLRAVPMPAPSLAGGFHHIPERPPRFVERC